MRSGEKGILLKLTREDFNHTVSCVVQKWFIEQKMHIMAHKMNCDVGDGIFWFKNIEKYNLYDPNERKFILFVYRNTVIASAYLKEACKLEKPIYLDKKSRHRQEDGYWGYFVLSDIVIFERPLNEKSVNGYFEVAVTRAKKVRNCAPIVCRRDCIDLGSRVSQDTIDEIRALAESPTELNSLIEKRPEWFGSFLNDEQVLLMCKDVHEANMKQSSEVCCS